LFVIESVSFDVDLASVWFDAEHRPVLCIGQRRELVLDGSVQTEVVVPGSHTRHSRARNHVLRNTHLPSK